MKNIYLILVLLSGCVIKDKPLTVVQAREWKNGTVYYVLKQSTFVKFDLMSTNLYKIGDKLKLIKE